MTISLSDTGKRFNREWIFRHFSYQFNQGHSYAITGANGSGKSTLLQVLSGSMHFNEGKCDWSSNGKTVAPEKVFQQVSICAPYLEVVEEMTVTEFLDFHQSFKPFLPGVTTASAIETVGLKAAADKQIRYYSSGMKQRVKLAQCIFSETSLVLLDEPCTNLDLTGIDLYNDLINTYCKDRLVIVCSNDKTEYGFCEEIISIMDYK
ncbi:MAG: ATP-binding cassette domain-containing protein [Chitinophagaceae bacterium]|nr:ATP-binding cassette domain-containing protein [Chitinophagaceae bacterium]